MECAGNGRTAMLPAPATGEPWQYGAVSTAEWTGVPLTHLLDLARVTQSALEVVAEGADRGWVAEAARPLAFTRSLPLAQALHPDTLLAYTMNGTPLSPEHGFPLRLIVPGWYGMAAIKWLQRLTVVAQPFSGFFQRDRYVFVRDRVPGQVTSAGEARQNVPLTTMAIRSLITYPEAHSNLICGEHWVRGLAWSGATPITRVELSTDGGTHWSEAHLVNEPARYAWRCWEQRWVATTPGRVQLCSRAFDTVGNTQPIEAEWNALGYANNAVQQIEVMVR
jgi:DMSO/TMAO reductase YedYZ molybdopterin-dependent catalytic subunit